MYTVGMLDDGKVVIRMSDDGDRLPGEKPIGSFYEESMAVTFASIIVGINSGLIHSADVVPGWKQVFKEWVIQYA